MRPTFLSAFLFAIFSQAVPTPQDEGLAGGADSAMSGDEVARPKLCNPDVTCKGVPVLVDDFKNRDPHQVYKFEQVSLTQNCGDRGEGEGAGCEHAAAETYSTSQSYSFELDGGKVAAFAAGMAVQHTREDTFTANCATNQMERVCVFFRTAHTMYTVNKYNRDNCCKQVGEPIAQVVVTSPNKFDMGSEFVCGVGDQCKNKGFVYWHNMEFANNGQTWGGEPMIWPFKQEVGPGLLPCHIQGYDGPGGCHHEPDQGLGQV